MINTKSFHPKIAARLVAGTILVLLLSGKVNAQSVSKGDVQEIVSKLATALNERYPFPEISAQYQHMLLQNERNGKYEQLTEQQLAEQLTSSLQLIHKDVHLRIVRDEAQYKGLVTPEGKVAQNISENELMQKENYGFSSVDLDPLSSVAYINIPGPFYATKESFEMAAAAMNMAAYSKYIIIDVRANGGGSGQMGRFLASYFFNAGDEKFYLNGFYKDRTQDEQEWTYAYVPGKRNPSAKVFILISPNTGSAAEGFAYGMQQLHRATIVGEASAGAGIAGSYIALKRNLIVFLPFKMVVAPHSQTGWEGTGVVPDSVTMNKDALIEARRFIWQDILSNAGDPALKATVQWQIDDSKANYTMNLDWQNRYKGLAGRYNNNRYIIMDKKGLIWRKAEQGKKIQNYLIKEVKPDVLTIIDLNEIYGHYSTRIYIQRDASGEISRLNEKILLPNGTIYEVSEPFTRH